MNFPEFPSGAGRSPRRELLGPRPTPLKVSKDSHKIRKPPVAPQPAPPRPPVIIYTVSPKIIHADPSEFMSLVQRLTCPDSTYAGDGTVSPAARFASIEKTRRQNNNYNNNADQSNIGFELGSQDFAVQQQQQQQRLPGILSPNPNSLVPISRNIFSPPSSHQANHPLNFFHDFSPVLLSNSRSFINESSSAQQNFNPFFLSPSANTPFFSPQINFYSPNTFDILKTLFDS